MFTEGTPNTKSAYELCDLHVMHVGKLPFATGDDSIHEIPVDDVDERLSRGTRDWVNWQGLLNMPEPCHVMHLEGNIYEHYECYHTNGLRRNAVSPSYKPIAVACLPHRSASCFWSSCRKKLWRALYERCGNYFKTIQKFEKFISFQIEYDNIRLDIWNYWIFAHPYKALVSITMYTT